MNDKLPPFKEITYTAGAFYRTLNINALNYPNHLMKSALLPSHFADEETEVRRPQVLEVRVTLPSTLSPGPYSGVTGEGGVIWGPR